MSPTHGMTPAWLWVVLLLVVWRAIRSLRPKIMSVSRLLIFPGLFSVWSIGGIEQRFELHAVSGMPMLIALIVGVWAGWIAAGVGTVRADRDNGLIERPGGIVPLAVVLISIGGKMLFFSGGATSTLAILFSIVLLGLLWGRTLHYWIRYTQAPHTALNLATR